MSKDSIRVGGAAGFWGDSALATPQLLAYPELDYLVFDYLAETTMAILQRARMKDAKLGYATDFVTAVIKPHLAECMQRGIRLIANAGGLNPLGCRDAILAAARELGCDPKVAVVLGDDLLPSVETFPTGEAGDIIFTHLQREIPPLIRYNLRDLGRIKHDDRSPSGSNFRRMDKFLGRSDQMVKIRGVNIYPMACLGAVRSDARTTGEWICIPQRIEQDGVLREEMIVKIEVKANAGSLDGLQDHLERRLKEDLGIKTPVVLVPEGQLPETNIGMEGKPRRLLDQRGTVIHR